MGKEPTLAWGARKKERARRNEAELCVYALMHVLSFASTTAFQGRCHHAHLLDKETEA